jgi:hypothetical protein
MIFKDQAFRLRWGGFFAEQRVAAALRSGAAGLSS